MLDDPRHHSFSLVGKMKPSLKWQRYVNRPCLYSCEAFTQFAAEFTHRKEMERDAAGMRSVCGLPLHYPP